MLFWNCMESIHQKGKINNTALFFYHFILPSSIHHSNTVFQSLIATPQKRSLSKGLLSFVFYGAEQQPSVNVQRSSITQKNCIQPVAPKNFRYTTVYLTLLCQQMEDWHIGSHSHEKTNSMSVSQ